MTRSVVQLEHIGVNAGGDCIAGRQVALQFRSCRNEVRQCVNARIGIEEIEIATVIGKRHRVGCSALHGDQGRAAPAANQQCDGVRQQLDEASLEEGRQGSNRLATQGLCLL